MQHAHYVCRKHLEDAAKRQRTMYDVKRQQNNYSPRGIRFCALNESRKEGACPKLQLAYDGPYVVAKKFSEQIYKIQKDANGRKISVLHHDKLKPYKGTHPPKWANKLKVQAN